MAKHTPVFPNNDRDRLLFLFDALDTKPWIELARANDSLEAIIDYILGEEELREQFLFIYDFVKELMEEHGYSEDSIHRWWNLIYAEEEQKQLTLLSEIKSTLQTAANKAGQVVHSAADAVTSVIAEQFEPSTLEQFEAFGDKVDAVTGHIIAPVQKGIARTTDFTDNFSVGLHYLLATLGITIAAITMTVPGGQIAASPILSALSSYTVALSTSATGNLWDIVGGCCLSIDEFKQGKKTAYFQAGATLQQTAVTLAGVIAFATEAISASLSAGFIGFSAAACMMISCGIEVFRIHKCKQKITSLTKSINTLLNGRTPDQLTDGKEVLRYKALNKARLHQRAQKAQHVRQAKALTACAIALTAVSIIAVVAASGATFGALPAAIIAVSLVSVLTVSIKKWWTSRVDHSKNLQKALKTKEGMPEKNALLNESTDKDGESTELNKLGDLPEKGEKSLVDKVDELPSKIKLGNFTLEIDKVLEMSLGAGRSGKQAVSLRDYLYEMLYKDPQKAQTLINYLTSDGNKSIKDFRKLLSKHRRVIGHLKGRTIGARILDNLTKDAANDQDFDEAANEGLCLDDSERRDNEDDGPAIIETKL